MTTTKDGVVLGEANSSGSLLGRLSVMMFLQYFVQGAYLPIASVYVERSLGFTPMQVGIFISALAVGPILAPFFSASWSIAGLPPRGSWPCATSWAAC